MLTVGTTVIVADEILDDFYQILVVLLSDRADCSGSGNKTVSLLKSTSLRS